MAKESKSKKKIISTKKSNKKTVENKSRKKIVNTPAEADSPRRSARGARADRGTAAKAELLFGRQNYMMMLLGFVVIMIGMFLMMGGSMPDNNTWDESLIYSTRRTLIAPFFILVGLIIEFFAIFRN